MVVVSTSFSPPEQGVLFHSPETKLVVDGQEVGTGALYITESNVLWGGGINTEGAPVSTVSLLYPNISMHALQREPFASLMVLVNYELRLPEIPSTQDKEDAGSDSDDYEPYETPTTELRFLPSNEQDVVGMYSAMCQGQDLHPDTTEDMLEDDDYMDGEDSDGHDDDDEFEDAEESAAPPDDAADRLRQMRLQNGNQNGESSDG